ncbi:MAG TPA: type II toxin-antitoxin system VapC family toxin [Bryobacteraceae bacterium]|nr:type II toxin-antitoxin system VapC family toxin [Bryobacteraceae bacterium]
MVIDTSAILAILFDEPEAEAFSIAVQQESVRLVSAATVLESALVLQKRSGDKAPQVLDRVIRELPVEIRGVDLEQLKWARYALETYGRGRHPARLNFGDCFSYALAKATGEPLLFKGNDFSRTDLTAVIL